MIDSELQSRASLLHANAGALSKQERDVVKGTEALRKENDKLEKLARDTERKIKEIGNVQNWAEVLERDFLVLEETMRLVRGDGSGSDGSSCSECGSGSSSRRSSWSGSYSADGGSRAGGVNGDAQKKTNNEDGDANGSAAVAASSDRIRINVTGDEKTLADRISEAMNTDLREPLESLSLANPPPSSSTRSTLASSAKGKERATLNDDDEAIHLGDESASSPRELSLSPSFDTTNTSSSSQPQHLGGEHGYR